MIAGHEEDILSIAYSSPNFLATAGYDGKLFVWNMDSGGKFLVESRARERLRCERRRGGEGIRVMSCPSRRTLDFVNCAE